MMEQPQYQQPIQQPIQPQPQYQQPQLQQQAPPIKKSVPYLWLTLIGIVILLVGGITYNGVDFWERPDEEDYGLDEFDYDDYGTKAYKDRKNVYDDACESYEDTIRNIRATGKLVQHVGLIFLSIGLFMGAIGDDKLPPNVRLGMLVVLGLILGVKFISLIGVLGLV